MISLNLTNILKFLWRPAVFKLAPIAAVMLWSLAEQHLSGKRDKGFCKVDCSASKYYWGELANLLQIKKLKSDYFAAS